MATKKSAAEECCAKCESDISALKKEIAALKKELKAKSSGGADPRVDQLINFINVWCNVGDAFTEEQKNNMEKARKLLF